MSKEISFGILKQTYGRSAVEIPDIVHTDGPNARTNILTYLKSIGTNCPAARTPVTFRILPNWTKQP